MFDCEVRSLLNALNSRFSGKKLTWVVEILIILPVEELGFLELERVELG